LARYLLPDQKVIMWLWTKDTKQVCCEIGVSSRSALFSVRSSVWLSVCLFFCLSTHSFDSGAETAELIPTRLWSFYLTLMPVLNHAFWQMTNFQHATWRRRYWRKKKGRKNISCVELEPDMIERCNKRRQSLQSISTPPYFIQISLSLIFLKWQPCQCKISKSLFFSCAKKHWRQANET
jgi:hypothetical protein